MELLAIWQRGFYWEFFSYSGIGTEGAGGGFIGEQGCSGAEWGDGAGDTRQQVRKGQEGHVAGDDGVGALQKGAWVAVVRCKGGGVGRW